MYVCMYVCIYIYAYYTSVYLASLTTKEEQNHDLGHAKQTLMFLATIQSIKIFHDISISTVLASLKNSKSV